MRLQTKIASTLAMASIFISVLTVWWGMHILQITMEKHLQEEGDFIATTLSKTLADPIKKNNIAALSDSLKTAAEENLYIEYAYITDSEQRLYAHSFNNNFPDTLARLRESDADPAAVTKQFTINNNKVIQVATPLTPLAGATLYIGMSDTHAAPYISDTGQQFILISLGIMIIAVAIGITLSNRITTPLNRLNRNMVDHDPGKQATLTGGSDLNTAALERSQQSLAMAQQIAHIGNWDWNIKEDTLFWSDEIYRIFGLRPNEFEADYNAFLKTIHPDDRDSVVKAVEESLHNKEIPYSIEHRITLPEGTIRTVQEQAEIIRDDNDTPIRMIGTVQDITERKQIEDELDRYRNHLEELVDVRTLEVKQQAMIINQIHDAVVITDLDGTINFWNQAAERLFLYPEDEALSKHISILCPQRPSDYLLKLLLPPLLSKGKYETELLLYQADSTPIHTHISLSVINNEQGRPTSVVGYFINITERKLAEMALQKRTEELSAVNKELESFSYSISHDLRTPLRAIDGFSQALLEDYHSLLDDTGKNYLNRVRKGAQHMARLIDDLLRLSKVSRNALKITRVNLSELASDLIDDLRAADSNRNIKAAIKSNITTQGDATLLRTMLQNLIGNAWKFTRNRDDAYIEFGCSTTEPIPVYYIKDNGVGFNMRYADKLFGAFQRLHPPEQFEGTGIGLATVQRIIDRHGGRIWAESEVNQGTIFYFTLEHSPAKQTTEDNPPYYKVSRRRSPQLTIEPHNEHQ